MIASRITIGIARLPRRTIPSSRNRDEILKMIAKEEKRVS
jgi:hypothetical protein